MIIAVDVDYRDQGASIAGVAFENWADENDSGVFKIELSEVEEYIPGEFYRRELPCILKLLEDRDIRPDIIVVDGFVQLDGKSRYGLGMYLHDALNARVPVIGVAKSPFKDIGKEYEIYRGKSRTPLYVTSIGIKLEVAKNNIISMSGKYRIPDLLKKVDQLCRKN
ncbi:MAG: endonuclease V [Thermodesulfobacteriota bacterium]